MKAIGGRTKTRQSFDQIPNFFRKDTDYRIYVARHEQDIAAYVLLFYYNGFVDYFVPAVRTEYLERQPLSLILEHAITDALERNCHTWNWGGTPEDLKGVYRFKKKWGAIDHIYEYYIHLNRPEIRNLCQAELESSYPYFYVCPYNLLGNKEDLDV